MVIRPLVRQLGSTILSAQEVAWNVLNILVGSLKPLSLRDFEMGVPTYFAE
ncbi:hypothetical protein [Leptolyngbya sp. Heron Island J]|uniref:hypothetical protein n=1 Tax=Leptolyngbya sp. Heron Island J TaxID=1385935 RepID=UPI000415F8FE|nr:hypothetical protein [Leptolyngbya sp. Heron Island J]